MAVERSAAVAAAAAKTKDYMDSLVPPDKDRFEHIAQVQEAKEEEARRRARVSLPPSPPLEHTYNERAGVACTIQKTFRGYRARREMQGLGLDATTRWVTAIREAQFLQSTKPRARAAPDQPANAAKLAIDDPVDRQPTSARRHWKKVSQVARRAGRDGNERSSCDSSLDRPGPSRPSLSPKERAEARRERRRAARMMGLQYFLEMVDVKHRYGSNLRMYYEEWKKSDTTDNFFYWLDYGDGKKIELDTCPRDRIERGQVRYLSPEERLYYLVHVDPQGRLCWAKNGARIDTTERYKDSIKGVVAVDDPTPAFRSMHTPSPTTHGTATDEAVAPDASSTASSRAESRREADRAAKCADPAVDGAQGLNKVTHISVSTIFNKLLRKSVRKNTWIFVADTSFRLYVGIKDSGAFQHSSFLQGSRVSAAGLIKIKDGRLSSLSPLSGHYRPPASNFRAFVHSLKGTGVDMSHVSISKSYTVLVGLETYTKTRRKGKDLIGRLIRRRDKMMAPDEFKRREEEQKDKSESAEKERRFLDQQRREEAAAAATSHGGKVVEKLKAIPSQVRGRAGDGGEAPREARGEARLAAAAGGP